MSGPPSSRRKVATGSPLSSRRSSATAGTPPSSRSARPPLSIRRLPSLLTPAEVAELLRTTREAVYARMARGQLPGVVRDGRRRLILRDELLKYLRERRAASPGGSGR
jgi:excisionase family DNA binding protein